MLAGIFAGCTRTDPAADFLRAKSHPDAGGTAKIVASIGTRNLTTSDVEERMRDEPTSARSELADREKRRAFVDRLVRREVLFQEGWARKLYERPRVRERLERAIVEELTIDEMRALAEKHKASEEELRSEYEARSSEWNKPEMVRLSILLRRADDEETRARAKAHAAHLRDAIAADTKAGDVDAFSEATEKWSDDEATKLGGGDLQFLPVDAVEARFGSEARAAVQRAEIGDFVIAEVPEGVALLRVTGRRNAIERSFESVREQIRRRLERETQKRAFDAWAMELSRTRGAKIDEAGLDAIVVPSHGRDESDAD